MHTLQLSLLKQLLMRSVLSNRRASQIHAAQIALSEHSRHSIVSLLTLIVKQRNRSPLSNLWLLLAYKRRCWKRNFIKQKLNVFPALNFQRPFLPKRLLKSQPTNYRCLACVFQPAFVSNPLLRNESFLTSKRLFFLCTFFSVKSVPSNH